jgi:hypothetical protein
VKGDGLMLPRQQYGIKNSRIWHICSADLETNQSMTLDNWTRYKGAFREIYYLNDKERFLEIDHFNHTFKFFESGIRTSNKEDFRKYFRDYLQYKEIEA